MVQGANKSEGWCCHSLEESEHWQISASLLWPHPYTTTTFLLLFPFQKRFLPLTHCTLGRALPCPQHLAGAPGAKPCKALVLRAILQVQMGTSCPPALPRCLWAPWPCSGKGRDGSPQ